MAIGAIVRGGALALRAGRKAYKGYKKYAASKAARRASEALVAEHVVEKGLEAKEKADRIKKYKRLRRSI